MDKLNVVSDFGVETPIQAPGISTGSIRQVADPVSVWRVRAIALIVGMTLFKLTLIATTKISNCEAYYYIWSRFLSWSYYDHPPLVAWMARVTTWFGHDDFAVRLGPVISSTIFGSVAYLFGERLFSPRAGFFGLAILNLVPVFMFVGFVLCPEAPMTPLWMLDLLLIEAMRENDEPWRPLLAGLVLGLAFLAKYTAVLLVLVVFLYAAVSPSFRRWLKRPSFYAGGLVAFLTALPVILWNIQRGWPTLRLHFVERAAPMELSSLLRNALHVGFVQFGAFHPLISPALLLAFVFAVRKSVRDDRYRFLLCASFPVLMVIWGAMLCVQDSESHWPLVGYIPLVFAAGAWLDGRMERTRSKLFDFYIRASVGLTACVALFVYAYVQGPWLLKYLPSWAYDGDENFIGELWGWEEVQSAVESAVADAGDRAVVASSHFTLCAHLLSQLDDVPQVYCPSPRQSEFDFIGRRHPPAESPVIYVNDDRYNELPGQLMPERNCQFLRTVTIQRVRVLQHYNLYSCSPLGIASQNQASILTPPEGSQD